MFKKEALITWSKANFKKETQHTVCIFNHLTKHTENLLKEAKTQKIKLNLYELNRVVTYS